MPAMLTWAVYISVYNSRADRDETRMNTGFGGFAGDSPSLRQEFEKPLYWGFSVSSYPYFYPHR